MNAISTARIAVVVKLFAVILTALFVANSFGVSDTKTAAQTSAQTPAQTPQATPDAAQTQPKKLDPAAWGGNHVGKPLPEYTHGDECLFCHRNTIGSTWQNNAHGVAIRHREDAPEFGEMVKGQPKLAEFTEQIEYFLGSRHRVRLLKKDGYGKFALLETQVVLNAEHKAEKWEAIEKPKWDKEKFANACAGCHATGIDSATRTFASFGLDCYTCHGNVDLDHGNDISKVLLSKKRRDDARMITSVCAQCHLRESKSRSTGLPYPNNFVAGDNLFQDLIVDWAKADDANLNAGDRHIWRNVRDVVINGEEKITCISCHQVHANTGATSPTIRHRRILRVPICSECHAADSFKNSKPYIVRSGLCEY